MSINDLIKTSFDAAVKAYEKHLEMHNHLPFEILYLQVLISFLGPDAYKTYDDLIIPYLAKIDSKGKKDVKKR